MKVYTINVLRLLGVVLVLLGLVCVFFFKKSVNEMAVGLIIGISLGFLIADRIRPRSKQHPRAEQ